MKNNIYVKFDLKHIENAGTFEGYASIFDVDDAHEDRVVRGAFMRTLVAQKSQGCRPKMLWQHDPGAPIGVWEDIREDQKGLYVTGRLLLELEKAREAYTLLKEGVVDGLSIGFLPVKAIKNPHARGRLLQEVDLMEISLVTFAANSLARVTAVKHIPSMRQQMEELLRTIRRGREKIYCHPGLDPGSC